MPKKGYKKETPRIVSTDVYRYIANNSTLSREQVKECFEVYQDMLLKIICSDNRTDDLTIIAPKIGVFRFLKREGRKNCTYAVPLGKNKCKMVNGDTPTYVQLKFDVADKLYKALKEYTKTYDE